MILEIWSVTDIIFCHFRTFFALLTNYWPRKLKFGNAWRYYLFTHEYHEWRSNDVLFLKFRAWRTGFFCHFLSFAPPTTQKIKILKKWGKIIILHLCNVNENHMMYGSRYIECNRQNSLSFWTIFCPFTPLTTQKIWILKNEKIAWRYHHFTQVY